MWELTLGIVGAAIGLIALIASVFMNRNTSKKLDKIEDLSQTVRDNAYDIKTQSDSLIKYTDRTVDRLFGHIDTQLDLIKDQHGILKDVIRQSIATGVEPLRPDLGDEKTAEVTQRAQAAATKAVDKLVAEHIMVGGVEIGGIALNQVRSHDKKNREEESD